MRRCSGNTPWSSASGAWPSDAPRGRRAGRWPTWTSTGYSPGPSSRPGRRPPTAASSGTGLRRRTRRSGTTSGPWRAASSLAGRCSCRPGTASRRTRWRSGCTPRRRSHASCRGSPSTSASSTGGTWTSRAAASTRGGPTRASGRSSRSARPRPLLQGRRRRQSGGCATGMSCGSALAAAASLPWTTRATPRRWPRVGRAARPRNSSCIRRAPRASGTGATSTWSIALRASCWTPTRTRTSCPPAGRSAGSGRRSRWRSSSPPRTSRRSRRRSSPARRGARTTSPSSSGPGRRPGSARGCSSAALRPPRPRSSGRRATRRRRRGGAAPARAATPPRGRLRGPRGRSDGGGRAPYEGVRACTQACARARVCVCA
mmetsp:Transcript_99658/g.310396  ORF Transcript_99658/g.310396 Transcript_99658/m.310396 type:complete len:373 (+) Transcript_99658:888-2006(+)